MIAGVHSSMGASPALSAAAAGVIRKKERGGDPPAVHCALRGALHVKRLDGDTWPRSSSLTTSAASTTTATTTSSFTVGAGTRSNRPRAEPASSYNRGDLLEVPRTLFTHFGIYLGDDRVAHFLPDILPLLTSDQQLLCKVVTNTRLILGSVARRGTVRVDSVADFVYGAPQVLVNAADRLAHEPAGARRRASLPGEVAARRAESYSGDTVYSLLWNNCEHFATHCRYGDAWSEQTEEFCSFLKRCVRDKRSVFVGATLGLSLTFYCGASLLFAIITFVISLLIWMAG
uniref:Lecithin retinol acyltransferase n=2 Tax=Petromyzon marinus TaxID=7757 RepID=A0AAJ7T4Y8_PETMA|nr:lecithin retinol acyltransferase [Petromyzon marinus]